MHEMIKKEMIDAFLNFSLHLVLQNGISFIELFLVG